MISSSVPKDKDVRVPVEDDLLERMKASAKKEGHSGVAAFLRWLYAQWEKQNPSPDTDQQVKEGDK